MEIYALVNQTCVRQDTNDHGMCGVYILLLGVVLGSREGLFSYTVGGTGGSGRLAVLVLFWKEVWHNEGLSLTGEFPPTRQL